jgi:hypothetical protein
MRVIDGVIATGGLASWRTLHEREAEISSRLTPDVLDAKRDIAEQ